MTERNDAQMMTPEIMRAAELSDLVDLCMADFPPATIGKLPRINCYENPKCTSRTTCSKHKKITCATCGQYITPAHTHIDFVGHAQLTARLLEIDPYWSWEPVAWSPEGSPLIKTRDKFATMWIRLTIRGVTRLGVGSVEMSKDDVEKELIGDALRNAGMRFGLALKLWAKGELTGDFGAGDEEEPTESEPTPAAPPAKKATTAPRRAATPPPAKKAAAPPPPTKKAAKAPARPAPASPAETSEAVDPNLLFKAIPKEKRQAAMAALADNPVASDEGPIALWPFPSDKTRGEGGELISAETLEFALGEAVDTLRSWAEGEGITL